MPKRERQFDEPPEQPVKKQASLKNETLKVRNIRSTASERTINMLFEGAQRYSHKVETSALKCTCSAKNHTSNYCFYCSKVICPNCIRLCDICQEDFCSNCSLLMHDGNYNSVCLSCITEI